MKRMTSNEYNPCFNCNFYSSCSHIRENFPVCPERARYDRLAAIEDVLSDEYDLDRLRELAEADREGRCGIPPVKMHQKIFRVFDGEIREEIVCGAIWEPLMPRPRWKVWVMGSGLPYYWHDVFGKTVFLTREEADAALRREQDG